MNRVLKFRAWDGKTMNYDYRDVSLWNGLLVAEGDTILLQFTGLTDKNGKEIFEGDIVTCLRDIGDKNEEYDYVVELDLESPSFLNFIDDGIHLCEVIGNIHENPELMEQP